MVLSPLSLSLLVLEIVTVGGGLPSLAGVGEIGEFWVLRSMLSEGAVC